MNNFLQRVQNNIRTIATTKEFKVGIITFAMHLLVAIFFLTTNISIFSSVSDNVFYHESGTTIAQLLHAGTYHWGDVYPHHWFPLFVGILYYVFRSAMIIGVIANILLSAFSAVVFYKILKESGVSEKVSFWGSLIVLNGYASFMYHSSILLKEAWVIFLLLGIIYLTMQMVQGKGNKWMVFVIFLLAFTLLRSLRFFIGFAGAVGFFTHWFLSAQVEIKKRVALGVGMIIATSLFGIFLEGVPLIGGMTAIRGINPNLIRVTREYSSETASTATHTVILKTVPSNKPDVTPVGGISERVEQFEGKDTRYAVSIGGLTKAIMTTSMGPFPWQLSLSKYMVLLVDTLFVYGVLIISIWGIVKMKWKDIKTVVPWIIIAGGIMFTVAVGTDNIGAIIRQRAPAVIIIGLVAAYGYDRVIYDRKKQS